jgi:hypothetical protein
MYEKIGDPTSTTHCDEKVRRTIRTGNERLGT